MKFENYQISALKTNSFLFSCATGVEPAGDHKKYEKHHISVLK